MWHNYTLLGCFYCPYRRFSCIIWCRTNFIESVRHEFYRSFALTKNLATIRGRFVHVRYPMYGSVVELAGFAGT